jgi:SAM-dependent methyltransferase
MKKYLAIPQAYQAYQRLGGFFGARLKAFDDYVDFGPIKKVFDIGCGPGHIVKYVPPHVEYIGFDVEDRYIDFANRKFGSKGKFVSRIFDRSAVEDFGKPDLILMNGVLHHMDDETAIKVIDAAADALTETGVFFALDGCFQDGQNPISKHLLANDRGQYVRNAEGYEKLVKSRFPHTAIAVRSDISWVPYTFAITRGSHAPIRAVR